MTTLPLEKLFHLSPNAYMVVDRELRYVAANEAYLRITASTLDSLLGKHVLERFPDDPADPNNASALLLRRSFERVLRTGKQDVLALLPYRVPARLDDGRVELVDRFWSATHTPLLDDHGEVAFIVQHTVDVTELHRLREASAAAAAGHGGPLPHALEAGVLQRAHHLQDINRLLDEERIRLVSLFDQAPGFMVALRGPEHVIEMCNQAYLRLTGARKLVGLPIRKALPDLEGQGFFELLDRVYETGEPFVGRGILVKLQRHGDGAWEDRYVDFIYQPVRDADGRVTGIFVQGHDVTGQRLAENAVRELNEQLERRVQARTSELQEANRELESFNYSVSHDLRAPLRHIAGFAQLLERRAGKELDEVSRDYLKTIIDSATEGGQLVDELLALSRMGRAELKKLEVDLGEVIAEVRRELAPDIGERIVHWRLAPKLPTVLADPALIRSAMKNILSNAIKYTRTRREAVVEIGAERTPEGEMHLWVRDNGVGFDMRYIDKLFGVFQRLHPEQDFEGTGIGLANVRRIVHRHGGRVWAEGWPNEGAVFHFTLPCAGARTEQDAGTGERSAS